MKFTKPSIKNLLKKFTQDGETDVSCFNKDGNPSPAPNGGAIDSRGNERPNRGNRTDSIQNGHSTQSKAPNCRGEDSNRDLGNAPYAFDIANATASNDSYRTALWTGKHLQLTVMSIPVGEETGIEMHNDLDQFIRIESGAGRVEMGRLRSNMNYKVPLDSRYAILIPAGTYHNIINTGRTPLKLYSIYTPKGHPFGTIDKTKADADAREKQ